MRRAIILVLAVVLCAALAMVWMWIRSSPEKAARFLEDRGLKAQQAQQWVAWLGGVAGSNVQAPLTASGTIEGEEVKIVSEVTAVIQAVRVEEGESVAAGQVVVELDRSLLEMELAQAQAGVAVADANFRELLAGAHPAEIQGAKAALDVAIAQRVAAETAWNDAQAMLDNPQEIDAAIVDAQAAIAAAQAQIEGAMARVAAAEVERDRYQARGSREEKQLYAIYDYKVQAAQAALDAAKAAKRGAEQQLAALESMRRNPLAIISQVHQAEGQYRLALAAEAAARAKLAEVEAGPTAQEIAVAHAQVARAQAAVAGLQAQLDKMTLRSPLDGVVASLAAHAGEVAMPGATLLTVVNLDEVKLVLYLPEGQLGRVYLGQEVQIGVDAFPGQAFVGSVSHISQQAEFAPRDVQTEEDRVSMVFAIQVRVPNRGHLLKPGMPADAVLR